MNTFLSASLETCSEKRDATAHLVAAVECHPDAIISHDLGGRILSWNPAAARIFGYTAAEALGRSVNLIIPSGRLDEERRLLETIVSGGSVREIETTRVAKSGRTVDVLLTLLPVRDANGAVIGAARIARDMTTSNLAERAVHQSDKELNRRTAELARFNHVAVGREMRVIELKQEVNDLLRRLGESPAYALDKFEGALQERPGSATGCSEEERNSVAPLDAVLCTELLYERTSRPPDHEAESRALTSLVQALADDPRTILQTLADKVLEVLRAGSAGLSLLTRDGERFYWAAIAGQWSPHLGGEPRAISDPAGTCSHKMRHCSSAIGRNATRTSFRRHPWPRKDYWFHSMSGVKRSAPSG